MPATVLSSAPSIEPVTLRELKHWLRLSTPVDVALSVTPTAENDDWTTATQHGYISGQPVQITATALPTTSPQIAESTDYYVHVTSSTKVTLHPTEADAIAGTDAITISDAGSEVVFNSISEDNLLYSLITAARRYVEEQTGRALINQTWKTYLDAFPAVIYLDWPPLSSVTSIKYYDTAGAQQTLSTDVYTVDTSSTPGRIYEAYEQTWPSVQGIKNAIEITYVAGYGSSADDVPEMLKTAIKMLAGHWYERREAYEAAVSLTEVPMAVRSIIWQHKAWN